MKSPLWPLDWLDNPILVKHVRSRLRLQSLGAAVVVVLVLCVCAVWAGIQNPSFGPAGAFWAIGALQAIILVALGASQVGSSVGGARASGILEFHRVSPMTPTALTLGFFFGAPVREYLQFACTLPFSFLYLALGVVSFQVFVELMVLLVVSAWLFHGLALLNALLARARANPRGIVGLVVFVLFFGGNLVITIGRSAYFFHLNDRLPFYGISFPWLAVVLLTHGCGLVLHLPGGAPQDGGGPGPCALETAVTRRPGGRGRAVDRHDLEAGRIRGTGSGNALRAGGDGHFADLDGHSQPG